MWKQDRWRMIATLILTVGVLLVGSGPFAAQAASLAQEDDAAEALSEQGLVIVGVVENGPAAEAGLVRGDILLALDGEAVESVAQLRDLLAELEPGDEATVSVLHGDEELELTVELGERDERAYMGITPYNEAVPQPFAPPQNQTIPQPEGLPNFELPEGIQPLSEGALVQEVLPESAADEAGLAAGDIILSVDGLSIDAENDLADVLGEYAPGDEIELEVRRETGEVEVLMATLGENPEDETRAFLGIQYAPPMTRFFGQPDQFEFPEQPDDDLESDAIEPLPTGAIVGRVAEGSVAAEAGLNPGDRIAEVDGAIIETPQDLIEEIGQRAPGDELTLLVEGMDGMTFEVTVVLDEGEEGQALLGVSLLNNVGAPSGAGAPAPEQDQGFRILPDGFSLPDLFENLPDFRPATPENDGSM